MKLYSSFRVIVLLAFICGTTIGVAAQSDKPQPSPTPSASTTALPSAASVPAGPASAGPTPTSPVANSADVASMDAIIAAVYDTISGPGGKKRDWDRLRSLFIPGARLIPTGARPTGGYGSRVLTVEDYIQRSGPFLEKEGFFEKEVARETERFGQIAHVFSTYEARHKAEDAKPFIRGINSIQLMNDGQRWWVVTIFWQAEDEKHPLPERYLKKTN